MQGIKTIFHKFKKGIVITLLVFVSLTIYAFDGNNLFEISKNIDIFVTLFRELNANYVDEVEAGKIIHKGIDSMLESLDPYTEYIPEENVEEYKRSHVSNEYAGIGALVQQIDGKTVVVEPYFGYPAQKADVRAGDIIMKVENQELGNKKSEDVVSLLKGPRNTPVKITFLRKGEKQPLVKTLIREEIKVKNVSYYGTVEPGIGYIKLDRFLDDCSKEVKDAFVSLNENEKINALILDLRGNGGGILQEAVKIVNLFIPKGSLIATQKGRTKENNAEYYAEYNPVDTLIPLVILVDNNSASASEIVAGAIQDRDRGVIIGERTFGKGLVQQTLSLPYNSLLKVTIAKYYTPSGRCIQSLDYAHRKDDGSVVKFADSLITEFKTKNQRSIYDGSGIFPDIVTSEPVFHQISFSLTQKNIIFNYANDFKLNNKEIAPAKTFQLNNTQYNEFVNFASQSKFDYTLKSEEQIKEFEAASKKEKYYSNLSSELTQLKNQLEAKKKNDLLTFKSEIIQLLESEIVSRYYFQDGRTEASFKYDNDIKAASKILNKNNDYAAILRGEGIYKIIGKPVNKSSDLSLQKEENPEQDDE